MSDVTGGQHRHRQPPELSVAPAPPPPMPVAISERWIGVYWATAVYVRGHLFLHGIAFLAIAGSMFIQPERYSSATLRGLSVVIELVDLKVWTAIFAAVGAVKVLSAFTYPHLARTSIAAGAMLMCAWAVGFVAAWLFDDATVLGPVAWMLLLGEHFAAMTLLDGRKRWDLLATGRRDAPS